MNDFNDIDARGENLAHDADTTDNPAPPSGKPISGNLNESTNMQNPSSASGISQATGATPLSGTAAMSSSSPISGTTGTSSTSSIPGASAASAPSQGNVSSPYAHASRPVTTISNTPVGATSAPANVASPNQVIYGKSKNAGSSLGKIFLIAFAGALVACVLAFGAMFALGAFSSDSGNSVTLGSNSSSTINANDVDATLAEAVASECLPSVVSISVLGNQSQGGNSSIYDYLYGFGNGGSQSDNLTEVGLGSGVIISDDGYLITNYHVIEGGKKFNVTVAGEQREAELVGSDPSSDIAILKINDGSGFTAIKLGDSANIRIGEWVMSIGSPFGLEQSVATGIISATSRSQIMDSSTDMFGQSTGDVTIYPNMIQTDAAINPGNSGGALVNEKGELIGINTLITSYSGNYSGVGFAIPSNYAISIAQSIISGKEPTRAFLGITMTTVNDSVAQMYGFATNSGAYVSSVIADSAAAKAGLQVGDIITAFDGQTVSSASDVMLDVRTKNPGDKVTLTIMRDGQEQKVEVTLDQSQETSSNQNDEKSQDTDDQNSGNGLGSRNPFGF